VISILCIVTIFIIKATPKIEAKPDKLQYYGQITGIQVENNQKIIRVKGAETPYHQHDNYLNGEVELIADKNISIGSRIGPNNEKMKLNFDDLSKMYESLEEGDFIAFKFKDLLTSDKQEIEKVIFTAE
jgi:hypothetical protein